MKSDKSDKGPATSATSATRDAGLTGLLGGSIGPNALRETPKARAALGILEKHGWLVALEAGTVVRGAARKEAWRVIRGG